MVTSPVLPSQGLGLQQRLRNYLLMDPNCYLICAKCHRGCSVHFSDYITVIAIISSIQLMFLSGDVKLVATFLFSFPPVHYCAFLV